jgi:putative transcriptional regulator
MSRESGELIVDAGTLLAAWPDMLDPNFMHRVVLVCQHDADGAYGLVTNRRTELTLQELMPDHELLGSSSFAVHLGGPVDHSTLQFLHVLPDRIPGGICLDGTLWLGGELDALARVVTEDEAAAGSVRVFLGYSGWGAGQLDVELGTGSWIPAPSSKEAVFGEDGEPTWRRVVRSIGAAGRDLENLPPDVSWN